MNCEATQAELKAYQDGELDSWSAWRVRRHVGRCAPCAEELRMIGKLHALLLSADLVVREAPGSGRSASEVSTPGSASPAWRSRRVQWASAGAAVLAAVLLAFGTTGHNDALAAVMQALAQMKTWRSCHLVTHSADGTTSEQWVRVPDSIHEEVHRGGILTSVTVQNQRESWLYQADKNLAVHSRDKLLAPLNGSTVGTVIGPLYDLERLQREAQRVGGLTIHERRERWPAGREVRVIDIFVEMARFYHPEPGTTQPKTKHDVIYLDAQTGALLKWNAVNEGETFDILGYDQPLPDALFTWQPPPDVRVVEFTDWWEARRAQKLTTAANKQWEVTAHALDVAANGDVWLTASERRLVGKNAETANPLAPTWAAFGMTLTDERGRVYVQFMCQASDDWPRGTALIGFTPLEPRRKSDPFPNRFTARLCPDHQRNGRPDRSEETVVIDGLAAPSSAGWLYPATSPRDAMSGAGGWDALYTSRKERARKGYHEGNVW
jgi:hypothetical protein